MYNFHTGLQEFQSFGKQLFSKYLHIFLFVLTYDLGFVFTYEFDINTTAQIEIPIGELNLSEKDNYNPNLVWIDENQKRFFRVCRHREFFFHIFNPKSDCIHHFPVDLDPNGSPF